MACNILVPQPGIELVPPAVELQNTNHWTAREVPNLHSKLLREICYYSHFTGIELRLRVVKYFAWGVRAGEGLSWNLASKFILLITTAL